MLMTINFIIFQELRQIRLQFLVKYRHSKTRKNKLNIIESEEVKVNSKSKSRLTILAHHKLNLSKCKYLSQISSPIFLLLLDKCNQSSINHSLNMKSKRSRSNALFNEAPKVNSDLEPTSKQKRLSFPTNLKASADSTSFAIKNTENPTNPSTDIYKRKIIWEFEKVLVYLGLTDKKMAKYDDLKMILRLMKMITPNEKCSKWDKILKDVWDVLSMKQKDVEQISIRSIKTFILGVWGIYNSAMYEISEIDSVQSPSTKDSKSADEFIFTSVEHLDTIRLQFYEMILHKLTFSNSFSEELRTPIKQSRSFCLKNADLHTMQLEEKKNKK